MCACVCVVSLQDSSFADMHHKFTELRSGADQIAKRCAALHAAAEQMSQPFRQFDNVLTTVGSRPEVAHLTNWCPMMSTMASQYEGSYSQVKMLADDNVAVLDAVLEACKIREDKRYSLQVCRDELQRARRKQEEARQSGKADKQQSAEQAAAKAVTAFATAKGKFCKAHARTIRDLRLYTREFPSAFDSVFMVLASTQANITQERVQVLQQALASTSAGPSSSTASPDAGEGMGMAVLVPPGQEKAF